MANQENHLDSHSNTPSLVHPHSPSATSEVSRHSSSTRQLSSSSSLPTPPLLHHHHGSSTNSINNRTSFKREQVMETFESNNMESSDTSNAPSPSNPTSIGAIKCTSSYSGLTQFSASSSEISSGSTQTSSQNGDFLRNNIFKQ